jgi:pilus assembly protein CpaF
MSTAVSPPVSLAASPAATPAVASARAIVDAEVRELVRQHGVDPLTEPAVVARLIDEVLDAYRDRSVSTPLPSLGDAVAVSRAVHDDLAGFGPLQTLLDDPGVEEIWINAPDRVFAARRARSELTTVVLGADDVAELVDRMLRLSGRRVDLSTPFVDSCLPDGSRLHVAVPPITQRHMAVNIRKFVITRHTLNELSSLGSMPPAAARFLEAAVLAGLNILVAGGTEAGKTTLLNALCAAIPARERVITVEEVFELRVPLPDVVALQTRQPSLDGTGAIPMRRLVVEALRMRPSRLVVGEVRHAESLDLLIALNSGLPGMCTLHANSAREALMKMCTLPLLAGENVTASFVVPTVAACVDLVVHVALRSDGLRHVREIVAVTGRVEADVIETSDIFTHRDGRLVRGGGLPPQGERFAAAGIDIAAVLADAGGDC